MKIQSSSIRPDITIAQQDSKPLQNPEVTKEVLSETKDVQTSRQLATSMNSEQSMVAMTRETELRNSLADGTVAPALSEPLSQARKLEQLRNELDFLRNQKQGLVAQISTTMTEIAGAQFANDQSHVAAASAKLQQLQSELAKVEVQIKSVLKQIDELRQQEDTVQDEIVSQQEQQNTVNSNLQNAAETYQQILNTTIPKP
ncbi:MAG TPA: hypothetical protein VLH08_01205 [Acidobacteriota bacterium]|nr:hypothetical protein [Acidobacteriota bacterium]